MSLDRLADVELQLCMHGLDRQALLQFARCSRRLTRLADTPFVWRHVRLRIHVPTSSAFDTRSVRSRPLRHAALSVYLSPMHDSSDEDRVASILQLCNPSPPGPGAGPPNLPHAIHEIDGSDHSKRSLSYEQWMRLLDHPLLQTQLRVLRLPSMPQPPAPRSRAMLKLKIRSAEADAAVAAAPFKLFAAIAALPSLHTLEIDWTDPPPAPEDFGEEAGSELANMHELTELLVRESSNPPSSSSDSNSPAKSRSLLRHVLYCTQLKRLSLFAPSLRDGSKFRSFFLAPSMRELQFLKLDNFPSDGGECNRGYGQAPLPPPVDAVSSADYTAVFSALPRLHTLELVRIFRGLSSMLDCLHLAPALDRLAIQPTAGVWRRHTQQAQRIGVEAAEEDPHGDHSMPTVDSLALLLTRAPRLRCTLRLYSYRNPRVEEVAAAHDLLRSLPLTPQLKPFSSSSGGSHSSSSASDSSSSRSLCNSSGRFQVRLVGGWPTEEQMQQKEARVEKRVFFTPEFVPQRDPPPARDRCHVQ